MTVYIVMDIGGTHARIALSTPEGLQKVEFFKCTKYDGPGAVVDAYCQKTRIEKPAQGVFAVAGPMTTKDAHRVTNGPWSEHPVDFTNFGVESTLMNDFAAQAYATLVLTPEDYEVVVPGEAFFPSVLLSQQTITTDSHHLIAKSLAGQRIVVMGPGTGLGVASAVVVDGKFLVLDCEGSHGPLPAKSEDEFAIFDRIRKEKGGPISFETVCSGPGLVSTYNAVAAGRHRIEDPEHIEALVKAKDRDALKTLDIFTRVMGRCAATSALVTNAQGGVVIAGGVIGKLGRAFNKEIFTQEFRANDLGKNNILLHVPVHAVTNRNSGLLGAHAYAQFFLN